MLRSQSLLSLLIFAAPVSFAQTSDASCLPYYSWTSNSQGKTPCEVASSLLAVCNGGTFDVLPLDDGQHYEGPNLVSNANPCICSTVTYSLMTACGMCQGKSTLRWSEWSKNCPNVTFSKFPEQLPTGLLVPAWAYQDITNTDYFDQFLAKDGANSTESSATPTPTTTPNSDKAASAAVETPTSDATSTSPTATAESSESEGAAEEEPDLKHANRVGGAVAGSLLGAALVIGGSLLWRRQRARRASPTSVITELEAQSKDNGKVEAPGASQPAT